MKRQIWGIVTGCCMSLMASCSQETEDLKEYGQDPLAIRIEARVGESSGVLPRMDEDGTAWTENDYIHVREASTGKTVKYRYTTSGWVPAVSGDYLRWEGGSLPGAKTTFDAWYPQNAIGHNDFTLPHVENGVADQSTSALLAEADWMVAHQVTEPGNRKTPLALTFERRMAKVAVTVLANSEFFDGGTIQDFKIHSVHSKVEGNAGDNSDISVYPLAVADGTVQTDKNPSLSFSKDNGPTYTAIIFPTEKTEKKFITLKVGSRDGSTFQELTLTDTPELKPGYFYKFKLKTGKTRLEVESVSVEDWEDGTLIGGNEGAAMKWDYIGSMNSVGNTVYENAYFWDETDEDFSGDEEIHCKYIYMPYIRSITAFDVNAANNPYIEKVTALICTEVVGGAFDSWKKLKVVDLPEAIEINTKTFQKCPELSTVNIPKVQILKGTNFLNCTSLEKIILPKVIEVGATSFQGCEKLSYVELPSVTKVRNRAFKNCSCLQTLILGTNHSEDLTVTANDPGAETMTSNCTLILGVGSSGQGATSGDTASSDFQLSTTSGYESLYSWAGLPWKEIIIKNATGETVKTYPEKNNN